MLVHKPSDANLLTYLAKLTSENGNTKHLDGQASFKSFFTVSKKPPEQVPEQVPIGMLCLNDHILQTHTDVRHVEHT